VSDSADARETMTFVIRLWRESNANGQDHWRGRVEHVASQQVVYVEDVAGVAGFIERWTTGEDDQDRGKSRDGMPAEKEPGCLAKGVTAGE